MNRLKTVSKIKVYEINGEDIPIGEKEMFLTIKSHWNRGDFVVIEMDGKEYAVFGNDLCKAVGKCEE